jgi:hypothetical protein
MEAIIFYILSAKMTVGSILSLSLFLSMECPQLWSLGKAIFHISMDMETQGIAITSRAIMGIMVDTTATTIDE